LSKVGGTNDNLRIKRRRVDRKVFNVNLLILELEFGDSDEE